MEYICHFDDLENGVFRRALENNIYSNIKIINAGKSQK